MKEGMKMAKEFVARKTAQRLRKCNILAEAEYQEGMVRVAGSSDNPVSGQWVIRIELSVGDALHFVSSMEEVRALNSRGSRNGKV